MNKAFSALIGFIGFLALVFVHYLILTFFQLTSNGFPLYGLLAPFWVGVIITLAFGFIYGRLVASMFPKKGSWDPNLYVPIATVLIWLLLRTL
jgi:hypothetical protein